MRCSLNMLKAAHAWLELARSTKDLASDKNIYGYYQLFACTMDAINPYMLPERIEDMEKHMSRNEIMDTISIFSGTCIRNNALVKTKYFINYWKSEFDISYQKVLSPDHEYISMLPNKNQYKDDGDTLLSILKINSDKCSDNRLSADSF